MLSPGARQADERSRHTGGGRALGAAQGCVAGGIVKPYSIALAIVLVVIASALVAAVVLLLTTGDG